MKTKTPAVILALLFGSLGIHKFYLGRTFAGVMYLVFCWSFVPFILSLYDAFFYIIMPRDVFDGRYNRLSTK